MVKELKHTEIGDIPVDWELQTFDETFRVISNNTLSRENLNNRGGAVRNIHYGDILTKFPEVLDCNEEEIPYVNELSLLSSSTQLLQDGDIVVADTAEDETVGKVIEVQNLGDSKLVAGLHTIPCRVKKGDFAPGWLGYYMNSDLFHNQIFYGLSKQAVKMRIREMGFAKVDGAFTYVNGQYVTPFSFDASALTDNQSFTISSADLFKAYCLNKDFRKAIDTGKFVYVEGHVCLDDEKYIIHSEGRVKLTQYALSHMDECCLAFDKGYSYQSKYQGQKYYVQMMYKTPSQVAAQEYSFEMNAHNRTLLSQIQRASRSADAMRLYPGAFSETLVQLMKEKKLSNKKLADASLVGERTIQRLRNEEEYPTTVQTVLGLCYGLQLSVPEAEMLVGKTDFNIKPTNPQNNAYRCVLSSCAENSIYEVNEMLESCGFEPLGSSKMG